jgi:peroxiredoxin
MAFLTRTALFSIIFLLLSHSLLAQVKLEGNAPSYAGQELVFYQYSDYITQTEEVVGRCKVDKKGNFSCDLKVDEITFVFSYLGIYKSYIYVEPETNYRIVLPQYEPKTEAQRLNPFFRQVDLHLGIENMQSYDINYLISTFDLVFNEQFDDIIQNARAGKKSDSLDQLIEKLEKQFAPLYHPFFNSYRQYRYGLLSQLALMQQSRSISSNYFQRKPILYGNPSYMELFNLVYDKYFLFFARSDKGKSVFSNISGQRSYTELKNTLAKDDVLSNDSLLELVVLKGLYDGFFDDKFSRRALIAILDSLYKRTTIIEHLLIAENIRAKVTRLLPGFVPSPFELYNIKGKKVSLNDLSGKYVYLNFCSTSSYTCLQEFTLLEKLYEKYKKRLEIVTVSVDDDLEDLKLFLDQTNYRWTFLHYGNKPEIVKDFDVRAFPTYFLIGPDRKLILSPAPSPKENFEKQLISILRSKGEL